MNIDNLGKIHMQYHDYTEYEVTQMFKTMHYAEFSYAQGTTLYLAQYFSYSNYPHWRCPLRGVSN